MRTFSVLGVFSLSMMVAVAQAQSSINDFSEIGGYSVIAANDGLWLLRPQAEKPVRITSVPVGKVSMVFYVAYSSKQGEFLPKDIFLHYTEVLPNGRAQDWSYRTNDGRKIARGRVHKFWPLFLPLPPLPFGNISISNPEKK